MEEKSSGGCLKIFLIVFVSMLIIGGLGSFYLWRNFAEISRTASAKAVEMLGEGLVKEGNFTAKEQEEILTPIRSFAGKIRSGEVSLTQGLAVASTFIEGPAFAVISVRMLEVLHVPVSGLSEEEKTSSISTLRRFANGIATGALGEDAVKPVTELLLVEKGTGTDNPQREIKKVLTDEELRHILQLAKEAADQAGVPEGDVTIDYALVVENAIIQGMENAKLLEESQTTTESEQSGEQTQSKVPGSR